MAQQAQQEGLERYRLDRDYYDIMLVGKTGQGKSTMADKLLIANPGRIKYIVPETTDPTTRQGDKVRVQLDDISMWLLEEEDPKQKPNIETHLKALLYFRTKPTPHFEVNRMRDPDNEVLTGTSSCQVFSNDTTMLRILDVPGFQDEKAFKTSTSPTSLNPRQAAENVANFDMGTMRNVIRIQSALGMSFSRVVFFLPSRGVLERPESWLKIDLQQLEYAFGKSVFGCMVAVATVSKQFSVMDMEEAKKFPPKEMERCRKHFQTSLRDVLGAKPNEEIPQVPIIFVSLAETCESILQKVQEAQVSCDHLELSFNPSTCANCGVRIGSLGEDRVTCSTFKDPKGSIPYEESTCHPAFKRSFLSYVFGRGFAKMIARKWPSYKDESCVACNERPFEPGCLRVGQKHTTWWGKVHVVDHTSKVTEPVDEPPPQADQSGAAMPLQADQLSTSTQPPPPKEARADQYVERGTVLRVPTEEGGRQNILVQTSPHVTTSVEERKGT